MRKLLFSVFAAVSAFVSFAAEVSDSDSVAMAGDYFYYVDSAQSRSGYPRLVKEAFKANGIKAQFAADKLNRQSFSDIDKRFDELKNGSAPKWLLLSSGSYDAFSGSQEQTIAAMQSILRKAKESNMIVVILTTRPVRDNRTKDLNLAIMNSADGKAVRAVDAYGIMTAELARRGAPEKKTPSITAAGYPLNPSVNIKIAIEILKAMGFTEAELKKSSDAWYAMPDFADISPTLGVDFATYEKLMKKAAERNEPLSKVNEECLRLGIKAVIK